MTRTLYLCRKLCAVSSHVVYCRIPYRAVFRPSVKWLLPPHHDIKVFYSLGRTNLVANFSPCLIVRPEEAKVKWTNLPSSVLERPPQNRQSRRRLVGWYLDAKIFIRGDCGSIAISLNPSPSPFSPSLIKENCLGVGKRKEEKGGGRGRKRPRSSFFHFFFVLAIPFHFPHTKKFRVQHENSASDDDDDDDA